MGTAHNFVSDPAVRDDVIRRARRAAENSGQPQWIHEHPHDHLCNAKCGPLDDTRPSDAGGGPAL